MEEGFWGGRPEGNRAGIHSVLCVSCWCIGDLPCCRGVFVLPVLGGQQYDSLTHRCARVLFWVLFPYNLLCSVD